MGSIVGFLLTTGTLGTGWAELFDHKKRATVTVKKEIFICDAARGSGARNFDCVVNYPGNIINGPVPFGPNNERLDRYVPCTNVDGCRITESNFGAQIFKDIAVVRPLSAEGVTTKVSKFHYAVAEDELDDLITTESPCFAAGFREQSRVQMVQNNGQDYVSYQFCIEYVGDCAGTIRDQKKASCTIQNYIYSGFVGTRVNGP